MSSLNDSTENNDSIPLDEESGYDSYDYESEQRSSDMYDDEETLEDGSLYYDSASGSPSRPMTPSASASRMTETSVNSPSGVNTSGYVYGSTSYYSSGYDSGSPYESTASPHSRSFSSTMGSAFATFYNQNQTVVALRQFGSTFRRPLLFGFFATVGTRFYGAACRSFPTYAVLNKADPILGSSSSSARYFSTLPRGYPEVPTWMCEMRASLPGLVESCARATLRWLGVPVLSDLQRQNWKVHEASRETTEGTLAAVGNFIPLSVILPIFSYAVLLTAKMTLSRRSNSFFFDDDVQTSQVQTSLQLDPGAASHSVAASSIDHKGTERSASPPQPLPPSNTSAHSRDEAAAPAAGELGSTAPHTVPVSRGGSVNDKTNASSAADKHSVPSSVADESTSASGMQYTFNGDVVCAMAGEPSVSEVNALIIAAIKYGCSTVLLPDTLRNVEGLVAPPPSLEVEFVRDVSSRGAEIAIRRNLFMTTVSNEPVGAAPIDLPSYTHPSNIVYFFLSTVTRSDVVDYLVSHTQHHVYHVADKDQTGSLVNECFYDRLMKERTME